MQVRESASATAVVLNLSNGSGITLGGTAGTIGINVPATTMGSATPGNYVYDMELNSGGTITRLLQGSFNIEAEVTK